MFINKVMDNEKGIVLVSAIAVLSALLIMGATVMLVSLTNARIVSSRLTHTRALFVAEAGIQEIIARLADTTSNGIAPPDTVDSLWETRIYLGQPPTSPDSGHIFCVSSVQDLSNALDYCADTPLTVKYLLDYNDINGDGETEQIVYYNRITQNKSPDYAGIKGCFPVLVAKSMGIERSAKRKFEVELLARVAVHVIAPFEFGGTGAFSGNPVTFSGDSKDLSIKMDAGGHVYIDTNGDDIFGEENEWGFNHGDWKLKELTIDDRVEFFGDSGTVWENWPPCPYLYEHGDIIANGDMSLTGNPNIHGDCMCSGQLSLKEFKDHCYVTGDTASFIPPVDILYLDLTQQYWIDKGAIIVTPDNVHEIPGNWTYNQGKGFECSGNDDLGDTTYYFTDNVSISGNPSGGATIVTPYSMKISGNPQNMSYTEHLVFIAGGDLELSGNIFAKGLFYSRDGSVKCSGDPIIFGALIVAGEGEVSGNPIVVYDKQLDDLQVVDRQIIVETISWREL
jgi:hypothetical protein